MQVGVYGLDPGREYSNQTNDKDLKKAAEDPIIGASNKSARAAIIFANYVRPLKSQASKLIFSFWL